MLLTAGLINEQPSVMTTSSSRTGAPSIQTALSLSGTRTSSVAPSFLVSWNLRIGRATVFRVGPWGRSWISGSAKVSSEL